MYKNIFGAFCFALIFGFAVSASAQVAKSGKGEYYNPGHWESTNYQTGEKSYFAVGEFWSLVISKTGDEFLNHSNMVCLWQEHWTDNEIGVGTQNEVCKVIDGDKDVILFSANCSFSSWNDWCGGVINGGTGKFKGISGVVRWGFLGPFFIKDTPPGPHKIQDRWTSSGQSSLRWEIEWKMP